MTTTTGLDIPADERSAYAARSAAASAAPEARAHARAAGEAASRRLRVMQVTWSLVAGGSEMYAFTVARNLGVDRFESLMCAIDQGGRLEPEIDALGIPRYVMHRRAGLDWRLMWRMFRLFRREQVDVIHTHHFNQVFYSALAAKLCGVRIVHTEHDVAGMKPKRKAQLALRLLSYFCHRVVAVGKEVEEFLRDEVGVPARKLAVVRAGVKTAAFDGSREQARRELQLEPHDRVAAIVARLSPEKGHRLLVTAFAEVVRRVPNARLLIAGEGVEEPGIREEIAKHGLHDHVRVLGVRRDVARILAASDVFCLSSFNEGLPIAVLEAMAAERPVVATDVGDLRLVVRDGETGRVVPPSDGAALAGAIADVLSDPATAARMGAAGKALVAEKFSLEAMVRNHEAMYAGQ